MCFIGTVGIYTIGTVVYHDYYMDKLSAIYFQSNMITPDISTIVKETLKHYDFIKLKVLSPLT